MRRELLNRIRHPRTPRVANPNVPAAVVAPVNPNAAPAVAPAMGPANPNLGPANPNVAPAVAPALPNVNVAPAVAPANPNRTPARRANKGHQGGAGDTLRGLALAGVIAIAGIEGGMLYSNSQKPSTTGSEQTSGQQATPTSSDAAAGKPVITDAPVSPEAPVNHEFTLNDGDVFHSNRWDGNPNHADPYAVHVVRNADGTWRLFQPNLPARDIRQSFAVALQLPRDWRYTILDVAGNVYLDSSNQSLGSRGQLLSNHANGVTFDIPARNGQPQANAWGLVEDDGGVSGGVEIDAIAPLP